jgi:histidine triad (HIT) family protein
MTRSDCIFCRIVAGEIPAKFVHEDDRAVAFHDASPQAPVHVLVVPRRHVANVLEAQATAPEVAGHLVAVATALARQLGIADSGFRLVVNQGDDGGQSVHHLHLHLLGGRELGWPPG